MAKDNFTLGLRIKSLDLSIPKVMGILNLSHDSFYDGGKFNSDKSYLKQVEKMVDEGADIIDIGSMSTRPGAEEVSEEMELLRLIEPLNKISSNFPGAILSIDTYRSRVAKEGVEAGAHIINDISGGSFDEGMFPLISQLKVPYILMHIKGLPRTMQLDPYYENVTAEVKSFFLMQIKKLAKLGVKNNIVLDPGFGFGKQLKHNYELLKSMEEFHELGFPMLVGFSRKSMINKVIHTKPEQALNGTTVLNTVALLNGANILRVHDVKEAAEAIKIFEFYKSV